MLPVWRVLAIVLFMASTAESQDFFTMIDAEPEAKVDQVDSPVELYGTFTHRFHYAITDPIEAYPFRREGTGAASIRYDLLLAARYRAANNVTLQLAGLAGYDALLKDTAHVEVDQSYIEWGVTPSLNIKAGRQLISLGESNYFQVADRINPVDERAFGLAELRETLLPVASTRLSYYQSRWGIDLVALHEFRPNLYDEPYGDFDPYIDVRDSPLSINETRPDVSLVKPDLVGRVFWSRPWGDLAVFASQIHSRQASPLSANSENLTLGYAEVTLLGASANRVLGNWLLKSEYAYSDGNLYLARHDEPDQAEESGALSVAGWAHQIMIGGRYTGIRNATLDVELLGSRIGSNDGPLGESSTQLQGVANLEYQMLNEKLVASLMYMGWARNPASIVRVRFDYALQDEILLFAGAIRYGANSDDAMLAPYENNDRIFLGFTQSF